MDKRVTGYILRYLLKNRFSSKADMARQLGIEYRSLLRVFSNLDSAKGGTIVLDKAILYCVRYNLSIDSILGGLIEESGGMDMVQMTHGKKAVCRRLKIAAPPNLPPKGKEVHRDLVHFLQHASACVCPCCEDWCYPWNSNTPVNNVDCFIGAVACSITNHIASFFGNQAPEA